MSGVDYVDIVCGLSWGDEGKGKYGRWLAEIYETGVKESLNDWLLNEGHAVEFMKG